MTDLTATPDRIKIALRDQGKWCANLGSPITAQLCETLAAILAPVTETERRLLGWNEDLVKSAFVLRIAGAFHALARTGNELALSMLYRGEDGDWPSVVRDVLTRHDVWLSGWLDSPPQTNEVGRAGVLWAGLMTVAARFELPMELMELGSSAGLNLNLDRFGYELGGVMSGDRASGVQIKPEWTGPPPSGTHPVIATRRGVDLAPIDVTDPASAERLIAFVWAGMQERLSRATAAIAIAQAHPPRIDQADIVTWLRARLVEPQAKGTTRVVMHSITLQYLTLDAREAVAAMMADAGARATTHAPLAWVTMEIGDVKHTPALSVTIWPDGESQLLAEAHPHGAALKWLHT